MIWRKCKKDGTTNGRTMGSWSRSNCEFLLMGSFGSIQHFKKDNSHLKQYLETELEEPIQLDSIRPNQHSEKP